ncbi:acriflavin resistance A domain protein [Mycobacterium xenopi 4042]|uniref:Acriflavin resistance A domain protein n=1 Tax=Mycobacterium xenopi 4042 TaxID=1299334 RepID=X7YHL0_MYCXE|nr:acriflavin resistance A domain protein [Mycobacterium xenopi 4042]
MVEPAQDVLDGVLHRRRVGDIAGEGVGLTPAARISATSSSSASALRASANTVAPRAATAIAEARPIPLEAPVMMTCRPTSGPPGRLDGPGPGRGARPSTATAWARMSQTRVRRYRCRATLSVSRQR